MKGGRGKGGKWKGRDSLGGARRADTKTAGQVEIGTDRGGKQREQSKHERWKKRSRHSIITSRTEIVNASLSFFTFFAYFSFFIFSLFSEKKFDIF